MASYQDNNNFKDSIMEQYPLDAAIDWIQSNICPEDVFNDEQLDMWAADNGYEKDET